MSGTPDTSWMWVRERRPDNPTSTLAVARARVADCEKSILEQKEKLAAIKSLQASDPMMYLQYLQTNKLSDYEKQLQRSEAALAGWLAVATDAEKEIPLYEDLMKRAQRWIEGHAKAEKKAADKFRAEIASIQGELTSLIAQFGTRGWASPPELEKVRGKDLLLRTMVLQLGASPPPTMKYTWEIDNPGKRTYEL